MRAGRLGDRAHLRIALTADGETIARLHIESWRAAYRSELSGGFLDGQDLASRTKEWCVLLEGGISALLAEVDGTPVGFVACGPSRGARADAQEWEIYNLHVSPSLKGQGLGSRLFDAAAALGVRAGARLLALWVFEGNLGARAFYERKGMHLGPEREDHAPAPGERVVERRYRMPLPVRSSDSRAI